MSAPLYVAQRQVGTTGELVPVYLQATTSPFLGLQNIFASTVSASWLRSNATGASSVAIISTVSLGTYSSGGWIQVNSTLAAGWYEFGIPNSALSTGRWASVHLYSSSNIFSPTPIFFELTKTDNQTYVSSQTLSTAVCRVYDAPFATSAPGIITINCSTLYGQNIVTSAAGVQRIDVSSVYNTAPVTTAAGIFATVYDLARTANITSTVAFPNVTISTVMSSVSFGGSVDVSSFYGSALVTTAAGVLAVGRVGVSSFGLPVGVSSFNTGLQVGVSSFDIRVGVSSFNSPVGVSSFNVGLQVGVSTFSSPVGVSSFNVGLQVGVSSFNSRVGVSSFDLPVGVSSFNTPLQVGVSSFGLPVGVSSFNTGLQVGVSSFAIRVGVSSFGLPVGVSSMSDKAGYGVSSVADKTGYRLDAIGSEPFDESYADNSSTATLAQLLYITQSYLTEKNLTGSVMTTRKLDKLTSSATFTLNSSSAPTSITRTT